MIRLKGPLYGWKLCCVCVCFCKTNGSVLSVALCDGNYFHRPPLLKWRAKRMNGRRRAKAPPPGFLNLGAPQARSGCLGSGETPSMETEHLPLTLERRRCEQTHTSVTNLHCAPFKCLQVILDSIYFGVTSERQGAPGEPGVRGVRHQDGPAGGREGRGGEGGEGGEEAAQKGHTGPQLSTSCARSA